jgi:hypothetical protein
MRGLNKKEIYYFVCERDSYGFDSAGSSKYYRLMDLNFINFVNL